MTPKLILGESNCFFGRNAFFARYFIKSLVDKYTICDIIFLGTMLGMDLA
jgi:hypothetical protein